MSDPFPNHTNVPSSLIQIIIRMGVRTLASFLITMYVYTIMHYIYKT